MSNMYLYKIVNEVNGKVYIGVTKHPTRRWKEHISRHSTCRHLSWAIQKHGVENFKMAVLCIGSYDYILELEEAAIREYDSQRNGYNIISGYTNSKYTKNEYGGYMSDGEDGGYLKYSKKKPIYVGGFWFPSARVAADSLKLKIATVFARVGIGFIEQASSARSDAKLGEKNPMFGKVSHQCRKVSVEGVEFPSLKVATQNTRFTKSMLEKRLRKGVEGFHYVL